MARMPTVGSESISWKTLQRMPFSSREAVIFSWQPRRNTVWSVTSRTDLSPSSLQMPPICPRVQKPWVTAGFGRGISRITLPGSFRMIFLNS